MSGQVLHAQWAGQPAIWHGTSEPRQTATWHESAVLKLRDVVSGWHLYYYRLKQQLTLSEMVARLESVVDADTLRRIELGLIEPPGPLAAWLAAT